MFNEHAAGAIAVERSLHEGIFAGLGLSEEDVARTPIAPTNLSYTSYLIATAYGRSFAELLGACCRATGSTGRWARPARAGIAGPLYRRWIETYGSEEFAEVVRAVLALTDRLGPALGQAERASTARHFAITSRYEWMFWDMAYRRERWPI